MHMWRIAMDWAHHLWVFVHILISYSQILGFTDNENETNAIMWSNIFDDIKYFKYEAYHED
jgi:hypothetical protein